MSILKLFITNPKLFFVPFPIISDPFEDDKKDDLEVKINFK